MSLWKKTNRNEQGIVKNIPEYAIPLKRERPELLMVIQHEDLWPYLIKYDVLTKQAEQRIKQTTISHEIVGRLLDYIEVGPTWRLHALLRACARTHQPHVITCLGFSPDKYDMVPSRPESETEDTAPLNVGHTSASWDVKHTPRQTQPCATPQRKGKAFKKGLRIPPMTKYIKDILDRYPDDGQILKELIQNADDADAKTVKFLLDEGHHPSSPEGLIHPDMAQFQGPALLVYNDAVFTEDDWAAICMMGDSIKDKDVVKTGRFGLGFKSIFHLTDLPIIASGEYVGIIDPHQNYLPTSADNWHLDDDKDFLQSKEEQFRPLFKGIFGLDADILSNAVYKHTTFRFPLRTEANQLSSNIYTADKVFQLFRSLELDEGQSLLFLKSVQCIEFYQQSEVSTEPKLLYRMKIADSTATQVSERRHEFLFKIEQNQWKYEPAEAILQMTIQTANFQNDDKILSSHNWLVYHSCQGDKAVICAADELKVLPWVGIALPISKSEDLKDQQCTPAGRLFATLPLPSDGTERTGFAFHVHAYFAMEQNRRHLKWPTADQTKKDLDSAPLLWNQCLVNECIPAAVVAFFRQAIKNTKVKIPPDNMYKLMPDEAHVDERWMPAVSKMYQELFKENCLYAPARDKGGMKMDKEILEAGGWLRTAEALQCDDQLPDVIKTLLKDIVLKAGLPITKEPPHVENAVKKYSQKLPTMISTTDVHNALLEVIRKGEKLDKEDALMLLQYFLDHGKPEDLIALPLLPLLSGNMTSFQEAKGSPIFLSTKEHPAALLPGLEHRLVDTNLPDQLLSCLQKLSQTGKSQLELLTLKDIIGNLHHVLPNSWAEFDVVSWSPDDKEHPSLTWLEKIWDYIHLNQLDVQDWQTLDKLHLLPVDNCKKLCRFSVGKIILAQTVENTLPMGVVGFLSNVGCIILRECPDFVYRHKELLYHSVHLPTCQGITDALVSISLQLGDAFIEKIKQSWFKERTSFNDFLSYMSDSGIRLLRSESKKFLLGLPLFSTVNGSGFQPTRNVSLTEVKCSGPSLELPVPFPVSVIDVSNEKVKYILEALDVCKYHQHEFADLVKQTLLPAIKTNKPKYTDEQVEELICYIMDHHPKVILERKDIAEEMAELAFMEQSQGKRQSPRDMYDPRDEFASLLGEEFFPHQKYHMRDRYACLEKLGMRPLAKISSDVFLSITKTLQTEPCKVDDFILFTKSLVKQVPDGNWWEKLRDVAFLRVVQKKPADYPNSLPWKGSAVELLAPKNVCHIKFTKQAGSTVPLVNLDETILEVLQAKIRPSLDDRTIHLKHMVEHYNEKEENVYLSALDEVYHGLSHFRTEEIQDSLDHHSVSKWIWCQSGFKHIGQMLLQNQEIDLVPFYYELPREIQKHKNLFHRCGVPITIPLENVLEDIKAEHLEHKTKSVSITAHDLKLAINILEILCRNGAKTALVPVVTNDESKLRFKKAIECTVWDDESELDGDLSYVHPKVPKEVSNHFSIQTVMHRSLDSEELDIDVEGFEQSEPLTKRLRGILKGYTDGLAVMKEMIQNADDAGATEVRLVYDMRENMQWRKSLLDPKMADWQGPTMWIYNNAVFTDEDFENIKKLSGETKADKADQIGTFGLGFNAVYNLTDVPSILSRGTLVMFDPTTRYLGGAIRVKTKTGLKINIGKQKGKLFRKYPDQFAPWNGVLGCNLKGASENTSFNGTLFRLPLRGFEQSKSSEISKISYDKENVDELLRMIYSQGSSLLLFTQNVLRVSVSLIENTENDADLQMKDLFNIYKEPIEYLREHGVQCDMSHPAQAEKEFAQKLINESNILKAAVKVTQSNSKRKDINSSIIIKSVVETSKESRCVLGENVNGSDMNTLWIVSQSIQDMPSAQGVKKKAVGGIAIHLEKEVDRYKLKQQKDREMSQREKQKDKDVSKGSYFSFLPLPERCPLPFHINGTFILDSSRRSLLLKTDHDKSLAGAEWNKQLMEGPVCTAYINALSDIISLTSPDEDVTGILPVNIRGDLINSMSEPFWQRVIQYPEELNIFHCAEGKVSMKNAYFLDENFPQLESITRVITTVFHGSGKTMVKLAWDLKQTLREVDSEMLEARMITAERFFTEFFLPNIASLPLNQGDRDALLITALNSSSSKVDNTLKSTACIPVGSDGKCLVQPNSLVHPNGRAACLYREEDLKFPVIICKGDDKRNIVYMKLFLLGMVTDHLHWKDLLERLKNLTRMQSSQSTSDILNRKGCVQAFIEYLDWILKVNKGIDQMPDDIKLALQTERFLPSEPKPRDWMLLWKGEEFPSYSGSELYHTKTPLIACTQLPILHSYLKDISPDVAMLLGIKGEITDGPVSIETIKMQMQEITSNKESIKHDSVRKSLYDIYKYLNEVCKDVWKAEKVRQEFSNQCLLLVEDNTERRLVSAAVCAFNPEFTAFPYLNRLPREYELFYRQAGVAENFSSNSFIASLSMIQEEKKGSGLDEETLLTVKRSLAELCKEMTKDHERVEDLGTTIYIPDAEGVLTPAELLCYNDSPQLQTVLSYPLVNTCITNNVASFFGVKGIRPRALSERSHGIAYANSTNLVQSIHSVLETHPCGSQILMELMQQADDAGATEIHFKLDPQNHKTTTVFDEGWKTMQGPSLCVENDAILVRDDLAGLFLTGNENINSSHKQVRSGIQSVYHLTDTPTVLATLNDGTEALCAYDPTCQYVKGTSHQQPGVMYDDVPLLRQLFPDVFECYQKRGFGYPGGTQFRFPLRAPEAAKSLPICHSSGTYEDVDAMLRSLTEDGYRALLFTTSLKKISITRFDTRQSRFETEVITSITTGNKSEIKDFEDFKEHIKIQRQEQTTNSSTGNFKKASYGLRLNKTNGEEENWSVVQHYGLEETCHSEDISVLEHQKLHNLPIGGVAVLRDSNKDNGHLPSPVPDLKSTKEDESSVGNLLFPSHQRTNLPVQVFGHFQHVAPNDSWNKNISEIVARAYLDLIKSNMEWMKSSTGSEESNSMQYFKIFPNGQGYPLPATQPMVEQLYELMSNEAILPEYVLDNTGRKWATPSDACFLSDRNMSHNDVITGANLCGLKIVQCPDPLQKLIEKFSHRKLRYFSPGVLLEFLSDPQRCDYKRLSDLEYDTNHHDWRPGHDDVPKVGRNDWKSGNRVAMEMITFCQTEKSFNEQLDQIPLLVTSDGVLRKFDQKNPVFSSPDMRIIKPTSAKFLHPDFIDVFKDVESPVFKDLTIGGICEELEKNFPQLAENMVIDFQESMIEQSWLEEVWRCLDRITKADTELLKEHGGHLSLWPTYRQALYLYPINDMDKVFKRRQDRNYLHSEICQAGIPVSASISTVADQLTATFEQPRSVLYALHQYQQKYNSIAKIFSDRKLVEYFVEHCDELKDKDDLIKDLPMFETLIGEYVPLAGNCLYVIPSQVPTEDMGEWAKPQHGILYLKEKSGFKDLYNQLGCILLTTEEVYIKHIFNKLEKFSEHGHKVHMHYVFDNLAHTSKVVDAMKDLDCVRSLANTYCKPCDLYDPMIPLFEHMQKENLPAEDLASVARLDVLRKAGMTCTATVEMVVTYSKQLPPNNNAHFILEYIEKNVDPDEQSQYLQSLSDIPFIPRLKGENSFLCPDSSEEPFVTLRGSVLVMHSKLAWTVAPLIEDLQLRFSENALAEAGVITNPSCELVARNIVKVCDHCNSEQTLPLDKRGKLSNCIDTCYNYITSKLQKGECSEQDSRNLQKIMTDHCCVPVDQAKRFVKPDQTVLELEPNEEAKPYLYRLPDNLTYSKEVLGLLGLADKSTIRTYQRVLSLIHEKFGSDVIDNEEDVQAAKLATQQVFSRIKEDRSLDVCSSLWLLSKCNHLYESLTIIYSNNRSMERGLTGANLKLLVDIKQRVSTETILKFFPETHRPKLLSAHVKEEVQHNGHKPTKSSNEIREHLTSEAMDQGFQRLIHHIMVTNGQGDIHGVIENKIAQVQNVLQNIIIFSVENLKTRLKSDTGVIGDWQEKMFFADQNTSVFYTAASSLEKSSDYTWPYSWYVEVMHKEKKGYKSSNHVFMYKVLADMVNELNRGFFQEYMDVLMVLLSTDPESIGERLDIMGILPYST